jgi:hypothetical protein
MERMKKPTTLISLSLQPGIEFQDKVKYGEIDWQMDQIQNCEPDGTILTGNGDKFDVDVMSDDMRHRLSKGLFDDR